MKPMTLTVPKPERAPQVVGPLANPDGSLKPRGVYAAAAFCRAFHPLRRLALKKAPTRRLAIRYFADHGEDELESLCGMAVILSVRRFRPGGPAKKLSTVVVQGIWGLLTEHYRPPRHERAAVPVWTNQDAEEAGPEASVFDRLPWPSPEVVDAGGLAAGDRLAALIEQAARVPATTLSERELFVLTHHVGHGELLRDVGGEVGISKERVRQIAETALLKLRRAAGRFDPL